MQGLMETFANQPLLVVMSYYYLVAKYTNIIAQANSQLNAPLIDWFAKPRRVHHMPRTAATPVGVYTHRPHNDRVGPAAAGSRVHSRDVTVHPGPRSFSQFLNLRPAPAGLGGTGE